MLWLNTGSSTSTYLICSYFWRQILLFFCGAIALLGARSPHCWGFTITLRNTKIDRTPLGEGSARRRDLYLTARDIHNRQTFMPSAGFEPAFPASGRPQTARPPGSVDRTCSFEFCGESTCKFLWELVVFEVQMLWEIRSFGLTVWCLMTYIYAVPHS